MEAANYQIKSEFLKKVQLDFLTYSRLGNCSHFLVKFSPYSKHVYAMLNVLVSNYEIQCRD